MPFEPGLSRHWYLHGRVAAKKSYPDMYAAWRAKKGKPITPGAKITAQESFYQGFMDARYKNPSPASILPRSWKKAQVRHLPDGRVQVKIPRPKVKMKTYYSKTLGRRVTIPEGR